MAAETGAFVAVWETHPAYNDAQVAGQLFAPGGARKGGEFRVGSVVGGPWNSHPVVAMAPEGSFVVVWQEPDPKDGGTYLILGQRFGPDGVPLGPVFRISEGLSGLEEFPAAAADPHGNLVVTWKSGVTGATMARLYRADGTPSTEACGIDEGGRVWGCRLRVERHLRGRLDEVFPRGRVRAPVLSLARRGGLLLPECHSVS